MLQLQHFITQIIKTSPTREKHHTPRAKELEPLQHIARDNNSANGDENADILNSDSLDDGIGQESSQGMLVDMHFSTSYDKEDMAQPITPVLKCEEKRIKQLITQFRFSRRAQETNWDQHGSIDYRAAKK
jgi:hypothetical protein